MSSLELPASELFDTPPPPRPTTPPLRRGFVRVLLVLTLLTTLVYGIPFVAERTGYAYEAGRAHAATEALAKLGEDGQVERANTLFRLASRAVAPAVVHIDTGRKRRDSAAEVLPIGNGGMFAPEFAPLGVGSGVIIDKKNGYIVTNYHVIRGADQITVRVGRGAAQAAQELGHDEKTDLAVLQVKGGRFKVDAGWGDSDKLDVGDWVIAIGSPFNLDSTVTAGIVSATGRRNYMNGARDVYEDFVQTDAAINPGNSGGPLVDLTGKVIGINTAIFSENGGSQGIGLAISSALAKRVTDDIISKGKVVRGYLGVGLDRIDPASLELLKVPETGGVLVTAVQPQSPADRAGLQPGDIITTVGGKPVDDPTTLRNRAASLDVGSKVTIGIVRSGKPQSMEVTIGELPTPNITMLLGLKLKEIPGGQGGNPSAEPVITIEAVAPGSPAAGIGLQPGIQVVGIGQRKIRTLSEYELLAAQSDPNVGLPLRLRFPNGQEALVIVGGPEPKSKTGR